LDILINNAGYLSEFKKIADSDVDEYWKNYEVNIKGTYLPTKAFLPLLLSSPAGQKTIINLSSRGAHVLTPGGSGYQLTKFAILRFTEYLMVEYGEQGLLAFNIHPGGIATDVSSRLPEHVVKTTLIDTPEMASDGICWLTQERREWLAGRYMSCNWDMEELMGREREIVEGDKLKMRMGF
jgi:NAD(P)-dependent dehydrogenase (short-subunit alcohol dehydrogenase family)